MNDTVEIVKSGAFDRATELLHKLAGPMFDEFGAMLGDKVRVYRVKNLIKTFQETERLLCEAGLRAGAVPPRLLLPIIENCSIEDNDSLQELWAGLLATASQQTDSVSPSFVETLKQLTPDEARHLKRVCETLQESSKNKLTANTAITPYAFTKAWGAPSGVSADTFERLGLVRRDFDVRLWGRSGQPRTSEEALDSMEPEVLYQFVFTRYAVNFLEACQGPRPSKSPESS
jgi:hypothetical protein